MTAIHTTDAEAFVTWMLDGVVAEGRGDHMKTLPVAPSGRLWLGRLAPAVVVQNSRLGERSERLEPCEVGIRLRLSEIDGRTVRCTARLVVWSEFEGGEAPDDPKWRKSEPIEVTADLETPCGVGILRSAGREDFIAALRRIGANGMACEFRAEVEVGKDGLDLAVTLVNLSPEEIPRWDVNVYEVSLIVDAGKTLPFTLDNLPDSFRYDRSIAAYGINGGVEKCDDATFRTTDAAVYDQPRPAYWDVDLGPSPDITFVTLAKNPLPVLRDLIDTCERWGADNWAPAVLARRAATDGWEAGMRAEASLEANKFMEELTRLRRGLTLLETNAKLRCSFQLANRAFAQSPLVRHTAWRSFQLGFLLANAVSIVDDSGDGDRRIVDTLWFATGGGKTETYLLYVLTAAFYDRLRGKREGITSWGRFPLRMLSLQQTQRFADVLASAELIRRDEKISGREFSLGFFVGAGGTPNRIRRGSSARPGEPDPTDPDMPSRYKVLLRCPFCGDASLQMRFDQARWTLDHVCTASDCQWGARPLPFRIVDDEIYRSLPTVVLGTLDKAASISMQAAMRGFYGPPSGRCSMPGHGFTYAPRSGSPGGCLFPGCTAASGPLAQDASLYAPTIRMQDELHLLRDSLGAVDSHYEALLDALQNHYGSVPKIIASSATLAGYDEQVAALYRREGRAFPRPGAQAGRSFWSRDTSVLARRFAGLAPRGVTLEYATDQLTESLQRLTRRAVDDPAAVAAAIGVDVKTVPQLVLNYGVDVVYGSNLKDVEAVARSFDTQIQLDRPVNAATLTGRTPLDEVRTTLARLVDPEHDFYDRIHLVAASSMLSHGVDLDRLNVMVMLGLPLATAEFIQTTSRVGRTHPGLVIVLHKIGRERDAAVYRTFPSFVAHADRLIDPVPITARSRRILELTFAGLEQARLYGIHEPAAIAAGLRQLTKPGPVQRAFARLPVLESDELQALIDMLGFDGPLDENLRRDITTYLREFYRALNDPASAAEWVRELFPTGEPMRSLRDVEAQAPVFSRGGRP
ncbi:helicase-related protein [Nocardia sp. CY41]|uniref:helicase-related protein n=1 Tax=Nocardia sp. CY41 TaxID=2608686 RepID=UPI001916203E|nr:helicase-related protein [Nocardia sp. CY41]